jgi:thiol:disulfide interchange protein DsbA
MNRREFSARLLAAGAGAAAFAGSAAVRAQGAPVEGTHYVKLSQSLPATPGKIEVIEFFWYGCPHCNAFEPTLDAWQKKLPPDVAFRRVPVAFRDEPFTAHQRIFYALDAMGLIPTLHRKVFYAIHVDRQRMDKPADIAAFMAKNGVDSARFLENYDSFSTATKIKQAAKLASDYKIDGVPAIGVAGKYFTSVTLAGTPEAALQVSEYLIQRERKA